MKSNMRQFLFAFLFCLPLFGTTPEAVLEAFSEKFPEIVKPKWKEEDNNIWEANFVIKGVKYRADFEADGSWVETERDLIFDQLPLEVRAAIELNYDPSNVLDIEAVESPTHGLFYDVEFRRGAEKEDIMFDSKGKVLDPTKPPTEKGFFQYWANGATSDGKLSHTVWELVYKTLFNLLTILVYAYAIYYRRHHDHKMLFLLLAFNLFLFPIFLSSDLVTAGFGFTIFALLALVRLRSEAFDKAEIAYLLGAISLTFVNTMLPTYVDIPSALLILFTAYFADKPSVWRDAYQKIEVDYRIVERERMLNHPYLREKLSAEYAIDVKQIAINRVMKNELRLTVMYCDLPDDERVRLSGIQEEERAGLLAEKARLAAEKQAAQNKP